MLTKMKLVLGMSALLAAGAGGLALANGGGGWEGGKAKMLEKYDANKDGVLDANEKAVMKADFQAKRQAKKAEMLAKFDTNKDGKLDKQERVAMREEKQAERFAKLDANGDGVISKAEFAAAKPMGRHHHGHHRGGAGRGGAQGDVK